MAGEQISICYSVRIYFNFGTFLYQINTHGVSLFMHHNVLVSLIIPSGKTKVLFVHYSVVLWIANDTNDLKKEWRACINTKWHIWLCNNYHLHIVVGLPLLENRDYDTVLLEKTYQPAIKN